MNIHKFVCKGVSLDLNVDEFAVDARIQEAIAQFHADAKEFDASEAPSGGKIQAYVRIVHKFVNAVFDREDAAELLLGHVKKLSELNLALTDIGRILGEMQGLAFQQSATTAKDAVQKLRDTAQRAAAEA